MFSGEVQCSAIGLAPVRLLHLKHRVRQSVTNINYITEQHTYTNSRTAKNSPLSLSNTCFMHVCIACLSTHDTNHVIEFLVTPSHTTKAVFHLPIPCQSTACRAILPCRRKAHCKVVATFTSSSQVTQWGQVHYQGIEDKP